MKKNLLGLLGSQLINMLSCPIFAQEKIENDDKAPIEQTLITVSSYEQIPVPLRQEAAQTAEWAGSSNFITADQWNQQKSLNIKDLLDFSPGVFVQQRNGAESARVSIRGSGLGRQFQGGGLLLLLDDIPLNTADGAFDFQAIDPWLIDYITVYRGANGMASGGSTLGGVINLGSTQPNSQQNNQLRLSTGSFGTLHGMFDIHASNSNSVNSQWRIKGSHFNQAGFRIQNQQNSNRFAGQFLNQTQTNRTHQLKFYHLNSYAELPSSLSKALLFDNPKQSRGFNINGNFHRNLSYSRLAYKFETANNFSTTFFVAAKELVNPVFTYIDRDSDDIGMMLRWHNTHNDFLLNIQQGWQDERRRENESGLAGADRLFRKQQALTASAVFQHHRYFNNQQTQLKFALQGIYAERDINETFPQTINSKRQYQQLNPFIGLLYQPKEQQQWFANISHSYEPPTFAELNNGNQPGINEPIKAQSANTVELGTRGFTQSLSWELALYYSQLDNEFIRFRFPDGDTKTTNANNSTHFGLEAGIKWQMVDDLFLFGDGLTLQSSYQWNQFKLDQHPNYHNNRIPGIPEHFVQSKLNYQHPSGWLIGPKIEWVPRGYFVDLANSYRTENYLITGLSMTYNTTMDIDFFIDINNLNNQTYISTTLPIPDANGTDGNYFYSGEGRSIHAGIKWVF